jgi:hypothetical protein
MSGTWTAGNRRAASSGSRKNGKNGRPKIERGMSPLRKSGRMEPGCGPNLARYRAARNRGKTKSSRGSGRRGTEPREIRIGSTPAGRGSGTTGRIRRRACFRSTSRSKRGTDNSG